MIEKEAKTIGLETSSLMPLIEITPRTLPLQINLSDALKKGYKFITDRYSVIEAQDQIKTSYENAKNSLIKAKEISERDSIKGCKHCEVVFVKALAENWYGREETLRWSDCLLNINENTDDFWGSLENSLDEKRGVYFQTLKDDADEILIESSRIMSYWVRPAHGRELSIKIKIVNNKYSLQDFFSELQPIINTVYREKVTINDVIDFYHLFSLYHDAGVAEVWSCNQNFVKRHEKYLENLNSNKFSEVFKNVRIR